MTDFLPFWWTVFNLITIAALAFYSMMEMACVSFNKVRLQYYVNKKMTRALWLQELLQNPSKLFGTTLIGVNIAMVVGSECAREFYHSIGLSPDLAPLTQVALVLILGELAPMFAARTYPEHVGMMGAPLLYASAKLMAPLLWCVKGITKLCQMTIGGRDETANIFLTQDELQKIIEEPSSESDDVEMTGNIFTVRSKHAKQIMTPIHKVPMLPSTATISEMRQLLEKTPVDYVPIYHQKTTNIIGIALPRDLIRPPSGHRVRDYAGAPWFVTQNTQVIQILKQFQRNNQTLALILDEKGQAVGTVDLQDVIEEIFGEAPTLISEEKLTHQVIDRTFPAEMLVKEFNEQFDVSLDEREELILADLLVEGLAHQPQVDDSIIHGSFELIVKEATLLEIKSVTIRSR